MHMIDLRRRPHTRLHMQMRRAYEMCVRIMYDILQQPAAKVRVMCNACRVCGGFEMLRGKRNRR